MTDKHSYGGMGSWPTAAKTCRERLLAENAALLAELEGRERPARYAPDYSPIDGTHVFIQWKGTDVCLDFTCDCGAEGHVDGYFAHALKCSSCGRVWEMPHSVTLIQTTDKFEVERAIVVENVNDD